MLELKDLKIGNIITSEFGHYSIVDTDMFKNLEVNGWGVPVGLTEEMFLKLGYSDQPFGDIKFYKDGDYISIGHNDCKYCFQYRGWANNRACYIEYTDSSDSKDDGVKYPIGFDYKYVHEIQNLLYFLIHKDIVFI